MKTAAMMTIAAAAGGVGQLLCQWASHLGATVIGTVGTPEKAVLAKRCGCAHTILYRHEDFLSRTKEITGGRGVDVAYDSVGRDTFASSLAALALRGHLVNFGQSSGPVAPLPVSDLSARSNSLTRPILFHYITTRPELEALVGELFAALSSGILHVAEPRRFALAEAADAHRAIQARGMSSSVILRHEGNRVDRLSFHYPVAVRFTLLFVPIQSLSGDFRASNPVVWVGQRHVMVLEAQPASRWQRAVMTHRIRPTSPDSSELCERYCRRQPP